MFERGIRNILFAAVGLGLLSSLYWLKTEFDRMASTRAHRNDIKSRLHMKLKARYGDILSSELDSRCGRAVYSLEVKDGRRLVQLYFDIDTGQPLTKQWLESCLQGRF